MTTYVLSIGLAITFGVTALYAVVHGTAGGVILMSLLCALCVWSAVAASPQRKKLEAEHARLVAEREARH